MPPGASSASKCPNGTTMTPQPARSVRICAGQGDSTSSSPLAAASKSSHLDKIHPLPRHLLAAGTDETSADEQSAPVRPSGPPRTPPAKCRRRPPDSPRPFLGVPEPAPPRPENPHLSGGTSDRHWAASAGSLRASRRPPGQSLCDSRTYCPACGVCVTTTLLRCPNGVRDH